MNNKSSFNILNELNNNIDTGIVGNSEYENLQAELDEKNKIIDELKEQIEEIKVITKDDTIELIVDSLSKDNMLTPELEYWFEMFSKFN